MKDGWGKEDYIHRYTVKVKVGQEISNRWECDRSGKENASCK